MPTYSYFTVDVFTNRRFGGNPLAVFPDAKGLDATTMQTLAAEMNYSETTFVLPPDDPSNTARVRIFNRTAEMPFAGHPNVGTAWMMSSLGLASGPRLRFEVTAGIVEVSLCPDGKVEIAAPRPLSTGPGLPAATVAPCLSIDPARIVTSCHPPLVASVGIDFLLVEVMEGSLALLAPDITAFRQAASAEDSTRLSILVYERCGDMVRARMFAPLAGTWEDPATGSANAALAALLLSLGGEDKLELQAVQGVEMGRPSMLFLRAWRTGDEIRSAVAGRCVPVFSGTVTL